MGLSFVTPALLAGIALVALPIVLHLVMRQVPKHMLFPAVRFLQQREQANRRQLRLRHLLLLLLRCAAIVLLAAALARPSVKTQGGLGSQEAPVAAALVFDTSPRMEYRDENRTRLEVAQETARWLLTQLPAESDVAVLESEGEPGDFAADLGAADQRISKLKTAATATPLVEIIEKALPLLNKELNKEKPRKEIYLFTDLARGAWPTDASGHLKALLEAAGDVGLYVIDVGVAEPRNFALGDVKVSPEVTPKSGKVRVETDLIRVGPEAERAVAIYVLDANKTPQIRDQKTFRWKPGEPQSVEFALGNEGIGTHQGFVRILGEDNLAADDVRYFSFDVRPAFHVLVAAPKPADQYALFLTEALSPVAFRKSGRARFECETVALDQLLDRNLENYAAVCLLDPTPLDPAVWARLRTYVEQGGGLAIWLGRNAQPIDAFNDPAALAVLPGKLALRVHAEEPNLFLAPRDLQHPLLGRFRPLAGSVPWNSFPVWRHWQFAGLDQAKGVTAVIPYSNGQPALLEKIVGKGRVLTMTTPISDSAADPDSWNQLATGFKPWPFVMLSNEMLLYLAGSGDERLNYLVGERAVLRLEEGQTQSVFSLSTPQGEAPVTADQVNRVLAVPATTAAGNYQIQAGGSEGGVHRGFSANIPAAATELERTKPDALNALLGAGRFRLAHNREEIDRSVSVGRVGRELYPLLIFLVALVLGFEHLLANRFYRRSESPEVRPRPAASPPPEPQTAAAAK
jgi:aerotolerance regulator-like protein